MRLRPVGHLTNVILIREAHELAAHDRGTNAQLLVHLGEIDHRKLYMAAGYSSMYQYCRREFRMTEDVAYKRIQAARAARKYPPILDGIIDGRLNLTTITLLRKHFTRRNAGRLLKAAEYATKAEVQLLIAREFPKPDLPTRVEPIPESAPPTIAGELVPEPVEFGRNIAEIAEPAPVPNVPPPATDLPRVEPLAPQRFGLQVTISQETHDKLRRAQELLGHRAAGDVAGVLDRALDALIKQLEKQKFAATEAPHVQKPRSGNDPRYIPNAVKREVARRDGGRCTFVSESGYRCEETSGLEFDHIDPVARGGTATVRNIRLRCRAHNQYEAERVFGAAFMEAKRGAASSA